MIKTSSSYDVLATSSFDNVYLAKFFHVLGFYFYPRIYSGTWLVWTSGILLVSAFPSGGWWRPLLLSPPTCIC
jgi:hypothetical protein